MNNKLVLIGVALGILIALAIPMAISYVLLPEIPVSIDNFNDNSHYDVNLTAYVNTGTTCSDTDIGIHPLSDSNVSFVDQDTNITYNLTEFCADSLTVVEIGCVEDFNLNGKRYKNLAIASEFDCASIGKTCIPGLHICG